MPSTSRRRCSPSRRRRTPIWTTSRSRAGNLSSPLPFPDATFDRILSINVLYALPDPDFTMRELLRVLKPNGVIVVTSPAPEFAVTALVIDHFKRVKNIWGAWRKVGQGDDEPRDLRGERHRPVGAQQLRHQPPRSRRRVSFTRLRRAERLAATAASPTGPGSSRSDERSQTRTSSRRPSRRWRPDDRTTGRDTRRPDAADSVRDARADPDGAGA